MPDYSRAEAILKACGLPDAAVRALALPWFDDHNPVHLLAVLRHCEQVGRPPPWWLRQLMVSAMPPLVAPADARDWKRWWYVKHCRARGHTWGDDRVYRVAAHASGERIRGVRVSAETMRASYKVVQRAYREGTALRRYPHVVIVESTP